VNFPTKVKFAKNKMKINLRYDIQYQNTFVGNGSNVSDPSGN